MEVLLTTRHTVPRTAVYDQNTDLSNTGKYADLHYALWRAIVATNERLNKKSNSQSDVAVKALVHASIIYHLCLDGAWGQVHWKSVIPGLGYWSGDRKTEFDWILQHKNEIGCHAAPGTAPARGIVQHFITHSEHRLYGTKSPKDASILRNLHRDAVTLWECGARV